MHHRLYVSPASATGCCAGPQAAEEEARRAELERCVSSKMARAGDLAAQREALTREMAALRRDIQREEALLQVAPHFCRTHGACPVC